MQQSSVLNRRGYEEAPMRKALTQSSMVSEPVLRPYRTGSPDVSASSSLAEPAMRTPPPVLRRSHRPTFGISLNELKAAIAPRAEHFQDQPDRFLSELSQYVKVWFHVQ